METIPKWPKLISCFESRSVYNISSKIISQLPFKESIKLRRYSCLLNLILWHISKTINILFKNSSQEEVKAYPKLYTSTPNDKCLIACIMSVIPSNSSRPNLTNMNWSTAHSSTCITETQCYCHNQQLITYKRNTHNKHCSNSFLQFLEVRTT